MGAHLITVGATVVSMKPGRAIAGSSWLAVSSVSGWTPRFAMGAAGHGPRNHETAVTR